MRQRKPLLLAGIVFLMIVSTYIRSAVSRPADGLPDPGDIQGTGLANVPPVEDAIQFMQNRIKENSRDAVSYTLLGDLYLRQARETADVRGYQLAEESFLEALNLIPTYSPAAASLASAYYSQHEFEKALNLAGQVYESNYKNTQARILMADSHLSLGEYQEAETIYNELDETDVTAPLLARMAYLEELKGNPDRALDLIRRAAGIALTAGGTKENVAWYLLRVGDMYFNTGDVTAAGEFYEASLRVFENYPLALAGLGRVRAAQGKYDEGIEYYQQAVARVPQPEFVAALGDLYDITGQPSQAEIQYATVETIGTLAALNQQVYNRQLANFYSDHNRNLKEALALAQAELKSRRDIYGYDALAWALYKNGDYVEAQTMMNQAMKLGTRDARLYYHAGMIWLALGDEAQARTHLEEALAINPYFSIVYAAQARETLQTLQSTATR
jgi:tetratricopeptide (TPR) repeat protein